LAKELHISPMEAYDLPYSLVQELLLIHQEIESYKADELKKVM
tara:strand:- start:467 stop:595 length:129 start_codon:yes stop_codon:yes gene_type:complete